MLKTIAGVPQECGKPGQVLGESEESDIGKMIARVKIMAELKRGA